ncbi:MAG: NAD(P)H-hydrate epimerase [Balneolaceae bacterium]|nr:NAD(P)H-hydrate epimerase [Balneolaceae bacterium]
MDSPFHIPAECKLYTAENSRMADQKTIEEFGIDGFTLMEIAAKGAASHIIALQNRQKRGLFICGKGNNGGDALAVARYLINDANHSATIYPVFGTDELSPDSDKNLRLLKSLRNHGASVSIIQNLNDADLSTFDYIVDGIFGTGLNSTIKSPLLNTIEMMNASGLPVYSMDIPSGLNADSGKIMGASVKAHKTFTFGTKKIGFHFSEAPTVCGEIVLIDLPFPKHVLKESAALIDSKLYDSLPAIEHTPNHKYDGGVVHIVAGSEGLTGAAIMAAKSAWKRGAGAVFLYTPKKLLPVYEVTLPQIIKVAVGSDNDAVFKTEHLQIILSTIKNKAGILLIGPGLGIQPETILLVTSLLNEYTGNAVIDADALAAWSELKTFPIEKKEKWLLTPHLGEAEKWLNSNYNDDADRFHWAVEFSKNEPCNLLIKGSPAFLATTDYTPFITGYSTALFNRAGFGDVLAGSISANISIDKSMLTGTLRALYETYAALSSLSKKNIIGPENLL